MVGSLEGVGEEASNQRRGDPENRVTARQTKKDVTALDSPTTGNGREVEKQV